MGAQQTHTESRNGLPSAVVDDLFAADSCRRALSVLARRGEPMVVEDLARAVVAARDGCPPSAVTRADRDAMAMELLTEHIPKLTATRVLRYNSMLGAVELRHPELLAVERR